MHKTFKVHINHLSRYYLLANYPLSRRCTHAHSTLWTFFDEETVTLMKRIKPTNWNINKTEAIDFETPFLWFDDDLLREKKKI